VVDAGGCFGVGSTCTVPAFLPAPTVKETDAPPSCAALAFPGLPASISAQLAGFERCDVSNATEDESGSIAGK
jgi:hypothetical protein